MFSMTRNSEPGQGLARKLTLAVATVVLLACAGVSPAKAWYDSRGYWHPNHRAYYDDHYRARRVAEHRYWCERHPAACGYAPRYYYVPRYRYYDRDDYRR